MGRMLNRVVGVVVVGLVMLQGCTSVVHYAIIAPREAVSDDQGCFRQCRLVHAGETKNYVACLRGCPSVRVVEDKRCQEVEIDASAYQCSTEHAQKFNPTVGILMIVVGVVALVAVSAAAQSSASH
jgi:hypothetical protein